MRKSLLCLCLLAGGCLSMPVPPAAEPGAVRVATVRPLRGTVEATAFRTQVQPSDWAQATASLSDLSGNLITSQALNGDGSFTLTWPSNQVLGSNIPYLLVVRRTSAPTVGLQTVVRWLNGQWQSVTNGTANPALPLRVGLNTTAITLAADAQGVPVANTVGTGERGVLPAVDGNGVLVTTRMKTMITDLLGQNLDPLVQRYWRFGAAFPLSVYADAGAVVGGKLYVTGGRFSPQPQPTMDTLYAYDPLTNAWAQKASNPAVTRSHNVAAELDGRLYVFSGYQKETGAGKTNTDCYDPATDTWAAKAPAPVGRWYTAGAFVNRKFYLVGGFGGTENDVHVYDADANNWAAGTNLPPGSGRREGKAAAVGGKLYYTGGYLQGTSTITNSVLVYDPGANAWSNGPAMTYTRADHAAFTYNGKLYVVGGYGAGSDPSSTTAEMLDPATNTWTVISRRMPLSVGWDLVGAIGDRVYVKSYGNAPVISFPLQ